MPVRTVPLTNHQTYHLFNKTVTEQSPFTNPQLASRTIRLLWFYQINQNQLPFSTYLRLSAKEQQSFIQSHQNSLKRAILHSYCLMPNHFHLLVTQIQSNGISSFVGNLQNSTARYFNTKRQTKGPLFLPQFKAVQISDDTYLMHVSRYIHLNPYTSSLVNSLDELERYPWSSLKDYLHPTPQNHLIDTTLLQGLIGPAHKHRAFIADRADYQRTLHQLKKDLE